MTEAVLVAAVRTPIGRYGGSLSRLRPDDLAALVVGEAVRRAGVPPAARRHLARPPRAPGGRRGLATMCVGVGQGAALLLER